MTTPANAADELAAHDLVADGTTLARLTFGVNLYTATSFYDVREPVRQTFQAFLARCPAAALTFHATETMSVHRAVTKRVLGLLDAWLAPAAPRRHYVALELKAAPTARDAPSSKYEVWSTDASQQANVISIALPATAASTEAGAAALVGLVCQLVDVFPLRCGLAGYAFECSRYAKRESEAHAWRASMRHPGTDIVRLPYDAKAVAQHGVKGVGWLTLLGHELVTALGGPATVRARLADAIEIVPCAHGVVIKAGPRPLMGDVDRGDLLPLYREVYRLLAPQIELAADASMVFAGLVGDKVEQTTRWYTRLA